MTRLRYDAETRKKIISEMYWQGHTEIEIANEIGYVSAKQVRVVLRKLNLISDDSYIDIPKVLALKKAGWTMDMIVDEFAYKFTAEEIEEKEKRWKKKRNGRQSESKG